MATIRKCAQCSGPSPHDWVCRACKAENESVYEFANYPDGGITEADYQAWLEEKNYEENYA